MLAKERNWLVIASLCVTAGVSVFFIIAPGVDSTLRFSESIEIIQIIVPVFFGYLGSAAQFAFSASKHKSADVDPDRLRLIRILTRGPVYTYLLIVLTAAFVFWLTNRPGADPDSAMTYTTFKVLMTGALALLAATTSAAASYLFSVGK